MFFYLYFRYNLNRYHRTIDRYMKPIPTISRKIDIELLPISRHILFILFERKGDMIEARTMQDVSKFESNQVISAKVLRGEYRLLRRKQRGSVWKVYREIVRTDGAIINGLYFCTGCKRVMRSFNTSNLRTHKCHVDYLRTEELCEEGIAEIHPPKLDVRTTTPLEVNSSPNYHVSLAGFVGAPPELELLSAVGVVIPRGRTAARALGKALRRFARLTQAGAGYLENDRRDEVTGFHVHGDKEQNWWHGPTVSVISEYTYLSIFLI